MRLRGNIVVKTTIDLDILDEAVMLCGCAAMHGYSVEKTLLQKTEDRSVRNHISKLMQVHLLL